MKDERMNATFPNALGARLTVVLTLARLLERLERSMVAVGAEQYRSVATRLAEELGRLPAGEPLDAVLATHPAAAELYENLNYAHAGLCRSPLDASMAAELRARDAITKAKQ
jgi:hypothetical protein